MADTQEIPTPTPYDNTQTGGIKPLPRVHIPTWFKIEKKAFNEKSACLDLDILKTDNDIEMYTSSAVSNSNLYSGTKLIDLGGTSVTNDTSNDLYEDIISIGTTVPRYGSIIAHSYANGTKLSGTNSAHVLYFKHAALRAFNFAITENHVIRRIFKLYRSVTSGKTGGTLTTITSVDTTYDMPDTSSVRMVINPTNESDASVASGTTILTLVEGGH